MTLVFRTIPTPSVGLIEAEILQRDAGPLRINPFYFRHLGFIVAAFERRGHASRFRDSKASLKRGGDFLFTVPALNPTTLISFKNLKH